MEVTEKYEALIADLAHSLYRKTHLYDFKDLFQIGLQSAIRLEKKFDPSRAKRTTYFTLCISRDMVKFIKKHNKIFGHLSLPKDILYFDDGDFWQSLPDLDPEEKEMVRMLSEGYSKKEIAKRLQLPINNVKARLLQIGELMCSRKY